MLLVVHGVVSLVPHTHGDASVPRLDTQCAAARSPVPLFHLHTGAPQLPGHPCLACLIGPASMAVPGHGEWTVAERAVPAVWWLAPYTLFQPCRDLPGQRAPPAVPA